MKAPDLNAMLKEHGWTASTTRMKSNDGGRKVTLWRREFEGADPGPNDTLLTLEADGEVQLFRQNARMPLGMVLSGKAPPA